MLSKIGDPSIDPQDPWADDVFDRKKFGQTLSTMIGSVTQPFVISVKGDWGSGKSVFLRRLAVELETAELRMPVIQVDAWKSDHYEDPIYALISAVEARLDQHRKKHAESADKVREISKNLFSSAATVVAPLLKVAGATADMFTAGAVSNIAGAVGDLGEALIKANDDKSDAQALFLKTLKEARDELLRRDEDEVSRSFKDKKVVIIIDELDRCRPDYAMRLLERVKHFFEIQGIVFVIAVDGKNLHNAVNSLYGPAIDGEVYLRKFFDLEMYLPKPSAKNFNVILRNSFDVLQSTADAGADWDEVTRLFFTNNYRIEFTSKMAMLEASAYFEVFADAFQLQLRDQAQVFARLNACVLALGTDRHFLPHAAAFIVCLLFYDHDAYEDWRVRSVIPGSNSTNKAHFAIPVRTVNRNAASILEIYISLCSAKTTQELSAHWDTQRGYDQAKSVALNRIPSDMNKALVVLRNSYAGVFAVTSMMGSRIRLQLPIHAFAACDRSD